MPRAAVTALAASTISSIRSTARRRSSRHQPAPALARRHERAYAGSISPRSL